MSRISIKNLQTKIPIPQTRIKKVLSHALRCLQIADAELSIVFVAPLQMKRLNARYLNHDYPTDILTFDYRSSAQECELKAEIILCPSVAKANAVFYKTDISRELDRYLIHGLLHLCGYDDHSERDRTRMVKQEETILKKLKF